MTLMKSILSVLSLGAVAIGLSVQLRADEPPTKPILSLEMEAHVAIIKDIDTDLENKYVATVSADKTLRVWEMSTHKLLQTLRIPVGGGSEGELYCVRFSPDGKTIAVSGLTGYAWDKAVSVYLFDRESGKLVKRLKGMTETVFQLTYTPNGEYLVCGMVAGGIKTFELKTGEIVMEDKDFKDRCASLSFTRQGHMVAASWDGEIHLYDETLKLIKKKPSSGKHPSCVAFSPDGAKIAVGYSDRALVEVLSATDLSLLYAPTMKEVTRGDLCFLSWSPDGQTLWGGDTYYKDDLRSIRRWENGGKGAYKDVAAARNTIFALRTLQNGGVLYCAADPAWGVIDPKGKPELYFYSDLPNYNAQDGKMLLSKDGTTVQFGYSIGGEKPARFSMNALSLTTDFHSKNSDPLVEGKRDGLYPPVTKQDGWDIKGWDGSFTPMLNGKKLVLQEYDVAQSVAFSPDKKSLLIGTQRSLRLFDKEAKLLGEVSIPGIAWTVNYSQDGRFAVAGLSDGTIRWYSMKTGNEILALFPHPDMSHWILWTPGGYYNASAGAENLLGWHVNRGKDQAADFFPVSQFRETFNRADVVSQVLISLDEDEALKVADAARGKKTQNVVVEKSLPPILRIVSPGSTSDVASKTLSVKYSVRTSGDAPLKSVKVLIDGRPAEAARKIEEVVSNSNDNEEVARNVDVALPEQDCMVTLIAENKFGSSVPATIQVHWTGKAIVDALKPKLYVLSVGVSKYNNPDYNLNYAAIDATDFAAALELQKGKLYREVVTKVITDDKATKENVLDGLEWIQKQTTSRDVAMVFLSGHGLRDGTGDYYYVPANFDLKRTRSTGILYSEFQKTISDIAGKVLFFVDTCHSGGASGKTRAIDDDINKVINELSSAENGAVVFSASTGKEYALEDAKWGHGAFTKALLEGLSGKADIQGTGRVTVAMLDLYLSERVKDLTNGSQHPTTQKPPSVPDFPILAKP